MNASLPSAGVCHFLLLLQSVGVSLQCGSCKALDKLGESHQELDCVPRCWQPAGVFYLFVFIRKRINPSETARGVWMRFALCDACCALLMKTKPPRKFLSRFSNSYTTSSPINVKARGHRER